MQITKSKLRQIIQEVLSELGPDNIDEAHIEPLVIRKRDDDVDEARIEPLVFRKRDDEIDEDDTDKRRTTTKNSLKEANKPMQITKSKLHQIIQEVLSECKNEDKLNEGELADLKWASNPANPLHQDPTPDFQRAQDEQEEWEALEYLAYRNAVHDVEQGLPPNPRPDTYRGTSREEAYAELYQDAYDTAGGSI